MSGNTRGLIHDTTPESLLLRDEVFAYASDRLGMNPPPLDAPATVSELWQMTGQTVTEEGLGGSEALALFRDKVGHATISVDHPNFLSFIPCAPTEAARLFDLIVSASSIFGGSWLEGAGAVHLENQVLSWLASEVGFPESAGGVFVQGGSLGNLSALAAARYSAGLKLKVQGKPEPRNWAFLCSKEAHSSLKAAARVLDVEIVWAPVDENGRLTGEAVAQTLAANKDHTIFAVVATSGTTNFGIVDDLRGVGEVANSNDIWFHIDGAYGLAGILSPRTRHLYDGSDLADSFIVDPHKWLFAPYDVCALVYKEPKLAHQAHTQHGEYIAVLQDGDDWNPSDFAYNLTRRTRGLPFWFSLATHGVAAYRTAVTHGIELARRIADEIESRPGLSLVRQPELSVVAFRRAGWDLDHYKRWSDLLLNRGQAFVVPSAHNGEPMTRFAIINPLTEYSELIKILDSMDEIEAD